MASRRRLSRLASSGLSGENMTFITFSTASEASLTTCNPLSVMITFVRRLSSSQVSFFTKSFNNSLSTRREALDDLSNMRSVSSLIEAGLPALPLKMRRILNCWGVMSNGLKTCAMCKFAQLAVYNRLMCALRYSEEKDFCLISSSIFIEMNCCPARLIVKKIFSVILCDN